MKQESHYPHPLTKMVESPKLRKESCPEKQLRVEEEQARKQRKKEEKGREEMHKEEEEERKNAERNHRVQTKKRTMKQQQKLEALKLKNWKRAVMF